MGWFDGIEKDTFVRIVFENNKILECQFVEISSSIVSCIIDGRINKFKENKIEALEVINTLVKSTRKEIINELSTPSVLPRTNELHEQSTGYNDKSIEISLKKIKNVNTIEMNQENMSYMDVLSLAKKYDKDNDVKS